MRYLSKPQKEAFEESGVRLEKGVEPYIPAEVICEKDRRYWRRETYVIPEYVFGFECKEGIKGSREHTECVWLTDEDAYAKLKWDSNRTSFYERNGRLKAMKKQGGQYDKGNLLSTG